MNNNLPTTIGIALATLAANLFHGTNAVMPPPGCGFYRVESNIDSVTARYKHCGDDFILIKYHWSAGTTATDCVPPWYEVPFYRTDGYEVVNAYYVTMPPALITGDDGARKCDLTQPRM